MSTRVDEKKSNLNERKEGRKEGRKEKIKELEW